MWKVEGELIPSPATGEAVSPKICEKLDFSICADLFLLYFVAIVFYFTLGRKVEGHNLYCSIIFT